MSQSSQDYVSSLDLHDMEAEINHFPSSLSDLLTVALFVFFSLSCLVAHAFFFPLFIRRKNQAKECIFVDNFSDYNACWIYSVLPNRWTPQIATQATILKPW
jgi:hypothetical protein